MRHHHLEEEIMAMTRFEPLRRGAEEFVDTLSEGWDRLRDRSAAALTRFRGTQDEADAAFPELGRGDRWGLLSADIAQTDDDVVVRVELPGLEEKDISVTVVNDWLTVRGEKRFEREDQNAEYHLFESAYGAFERRFPLPCAVKSKRAKARYRNGVLTVRMPRAEHAKRKQIRVTAG
jgi:HSP20 family protein